MRSPNESPCNAAANDLNIEYLYGNRLRKADRQMHFRLAAYDPNRKYSVSRCMS